MACGKEKIEYLVLTGRVDGKRAKGRQRLVFSQSIGTLNWYKSTRPHRKDGKKTGERYCGCRIRQGSGMTPRMDGSNEMILDNREMCALYKL